MIPRRRFLQYAALAVPATSLLGTATASAATTATVTPLGVPLRDVLLIGGAIGPGPDGRPVMWSAASGEPAHLVAIDPLTRKVVSSQVIDGAPGSYAVVVAPDGTVYVGAYNTGTLHRRRPGPNSPVENLGRPLPNQTYIWRLAVDADGVLYGATYPGARVFSYHPSGEVRDYGQLAPGIEYARSIALLDGKLYVGSQPDAHVFEIDVATGAKRELPLPAEVGDGVGVPVYDLNAYDGRVYARIGSAISGKLAIWDVKGQRWSQVLDGVAGLDVSEPGPKGLVYYTRNGELTGLKPSHGTEYPTGLKFAGRVVNNRGIGWVDLRHPDWPGQTLVGMLWRGELFRYNPKTGRSDVGGTDVTGEPIPLASLAVGTTGRLWAGGYLNGGIAQVDPATGQPGFQRFAQTESVLDLGDTVWIGCYPDSRFYAYDPTAPWNSPEYSPGPAGAPENPVKVSDLKAQDQVRARTSVDAGTHIAYGTMPNTTLGGALVLVDKATRAAQVHRPVVTDQSIVALAYAGGLVVGGTSIHGGYSVPPPTQTEARLFGWNVAAGTTTFQLVPVAGAKVIDGLCVDSAGALWGLAGGRLFQFDVATQTITRSVTLPASGGRLAYHAAGDAFFVHTGQVLLRIPRSDLSITEVVRQQAQYLAVHPDGRVFLGDGAELYRVEL
ncbi:hypothetical protein FB561_7099 [Kribbella amoyensis]|uniref:Outer membrane protein assembly factor BamB n=1 Tax=Kribbella amoyensis TaxID=996641 RepID=A0A561B2X6_9ACTN|nr:hypothetical protein [Kribbella amoyensis]TWD73211.1 hypothetical protein FB561_7099 [Kribbella amoyensis]